MKKVIGMFVLIVFVLISVKGTYAQPVEGKKFEFSTSASLSIVKYEDWEASTFVNIPIRFGIFVFEGLQIEPELLFTIPDKFEYMGIFGWLNLAYNFKTKNKIVPFVLVGGGYGNGYPMLSMASDYETGVPAVNAGAGAKFLIGDSAAIRVEYRFAYYMPSEDENRMDNNVLVGVSIFF